MYRRVRLHGLAKGVGVQLTRSGGVQGVALEARHRRRSTLAVRRALSDEVAIAINALNRMRELGRPNYVRIA
jgi:hypothetical protein